MPLPEKVVEQIGRDIPSSPGWSFGIISFSGGILCIVIVLWVGLAFGYKPYLDSQTATIEDQINQENQAISPTDQNTLINYYSQISNLQTILRDHQFLSNLFPWLEQNTEANVYYTSLSFASGNQLTLAASARTITDANQQIAIFESSPQVQTVNVSGISAPGTTGYYSLTFTITLNPSLFGNGLQKP